MRNSKSVQVAVGLSMVLSSAVAGLSYAKEHDYTLSCEYTNNVGGFKIRMGSLLPLESFDSDPGSYSCSLISTLLLPIYVPLSLVSSPIEGTIVVILDSSIASRDEVQLKQFASGFQLCELQNNEFNQCESLKKARQEAVAKNLAFPKTEKDSALVHAAVLNAFGTNIYSAENAAKTGTTADQIANRIIEDSNQNIQGLIQHGDLSKDDAAGANNYKDYVAVFVGSYLKNSTSPQWKTL